MLQKHASFFIYLPSDSVLAIDNARTIYELIAKFIPTSEVIFWGVGKKFRGKLPLVN